MLIFIRRKGRAPLRPAVFLLVLLLLAAGPLQGRGYAADEAAEESAVKEAVETFLRNFTEEALLYEERDQRVCTVLDPDISFAPDAWEQVYKLSGKDATLAQMRENIAFVEKKADYLAAMRQMQDIFRVNLKLAYTYQKIDFQDDVCYVKVTEAAGFRYTDTALPSVNESIYSVQLVKLDGRWLVAGFTDGSSFDKQYMKQGGGFDVDAALQVLEESLQAENCKVTNPFSGDVGWGQVPYDRQSAAAYAYTYSRLLPEDVRGDYYSPLFVSYAGLGGDCMNFASQCIWAGFGGSETAAAVNGRWQPMDNAGGSLWFSRAHGGKGVAESWISCQAFRNYLTGTRDASGSGGSNAGKDSGMYATVLSVAKGSQVVGVEPEELVGAAAHVDGGGGSYSHTIVITAAEGSRRSQIWFCGHTKNVSNVKLGDCYSSCPMKIYIPRYMRTGAAQDGVLRPLRIPPVAVGGSGLLGVRAGCAQARMWVDVTTPEGVAVQAAVAENADSCMAEFEFTQVGLYKVEGFALAGQDGEPVSVTYFVRCYEPAAELLEDEVPAEDAEPMEEDDASETPDAAGTELEEDAQIVIDAFPDGI